MYLYQLLLSYRIYDHGIRASSKVRLISRRSWNRGFAGSGTAASSLVIETWKVTVTTKPGWSTNQRLTTTKIPVAGVDVCEAQTKIPVAGVDVWEVHAPAEFSSGAWWCATRHFGPFFHSWVCLFISAQAVVVLWPTKHSYPYFWSIRPS